RAVTSTPPARSSAASSRPGPGSPSAGCGWSRHCPTGPRCRNLLRRFPRRGGRRRPVEPSLPPLPGRTPASTRPSTGTTGSDGAGSLDGIRPAGAPPGSRLRAARPAPGLPDRRAERVAERVIGRGVFASLKPITGEITGRSGDPVRVRLGVVAGAVAEPVVQLPEPAGGGRDRVRGREGDSRLRQRGPDEPDAVVRAQPGGQMARLARRRFETADAQAHHLK